MKILLADTNRDNRERLKDLLQGLNAVFENDLHVLKEVVDGEKALEEVRSGNYELLISELRLPRKSGVHLLQELRRANERCRVILYGALEDLETLTLGQSEGAVGYMLRPFRKTDIERLLKKVIAYQNMMKEMDSRHRALRNEEGMEADEDHGRSLAKEKLTSWLKEGEMIRKEELDTAFFGRTPGYGVAFFHAPDSESKVRDELRSRLEERDAILVSWIEKSERVAAVFTDLTGRSALLKHCADIIKGAKGISSSRIHCGIGDVTRVYEGIPSARKGALFCLDYMEQEKDTEVLPIWLLENRETKVWYWCDELESQAIRAALLGNKEIMFRLIDEMLQHAKVNQIDYRFLPKAFLNLMLRISREAEEHGLSFENIFAETFTTKKLAASGSLEESFLYLREGMTAISESAATQIKKRRGSMADAIKRHIAANLTQGISVTTMCEEYDLLPAHLEKLAKDFYQMGIKELILSEKMERAKELVLERELDDSGIALMLGIDSRKFQELFYKHHGCSTFELKRR